MATIRHYEEDEEPRIGSRRVYLTYSRSGSMETRDDESMPVSTGKFISKDSGGGNPLQVIVSIISSFLWVLFCSVVAGLHVFELCCVSQMCHRLPSAQDRRDTAFSYSLFFFYIFGDTLLCAHTRL